MTFFEMLVLIRQKDVKRINIIIINQHRTRDRDGKENVKNHFEISTRKFCNFPLKIPTYIFLFYMYNDRKRLIELALQNFLFQN